jgi:peptidoglycan/LPS O-acetylase OafA/YrhL
MTSRDGRIHSLQVFRALAAILVVLNHSTVVGREVLRLPEFANAHALGIPDLADTFFFGDPRGSIRVDLFFVISGFMIFYAYEHYLGDAKRLGTYVSRRLIRIYPILWIFTLSKIALILAYPMRAKPYEASPVTMFASMLALPQQNLPLIAATWTLPFEMLFYLMFGIGILVGSRRAIVLAIGWGVTIVAANVASFLLSNASHEPASLLMGLVPFLLYERNLDFLLGCAAAYMVRRRTITRPGLVIALGSLGLIVSCVLIATGQGVVSYALLVGLPSVLLIAGTASLELERHFRVPRSLTYVGDASYSIFVSHSTFLNLFGLVLIVSGPWPVGPVYLLVGMTVFAVLGGVLVYWLIEQPLLAYLRHRLLEPRTSTADTSFALSQTDGVPATVRS